MQEYGTRKLRTKVLDYGNRALIPLNTSNVRTVKIQMKGFNLKRKSLSNIL
jgi:hypothetical protein